VKYTDQRLDFVRVDIVIKWRNLSFATQGLVLKKKHFTGVFFRSIRTVTRTSVQGFNPAQGWGLENDCEAVDEVMGGDYYRLIGVGEGKRISR